MTGKTKNTVLHLELLISWTGREAAERWKIYGGFAGQYWSRDLQPTPGGYLEEYEWVQFVVGTRYLFFVERDWSVGADLSVRWNVGGSVLVHFSQLSPSLVDFSLPLGMALGARVQVPIRWQINEAVGILILPYFEYAPIGEGSKQLVPNTANVPLQANEPASNTFVGGLIIGPTLSY